ncbi:amidohydrolase family protein [Halobaculum sp. CBA1158]|uniref:metal-dependent hydrolase family protein n=1 Tax=Halobaculum sp. CBA1158 TaxID=2904243 RepID=UPI001F3549D3|nr:amidohydrolase family protein [Halobaculum sp. CBA1158]UIP01139.1 amidohydrolase family protein [Halobaculum sp. CBA1158]
MLLRNATLADAAGVRDGDLRVAEGQIADAGDLTPRGDEAVVDCEGRAIVPGLVDAHVHLSLSGEPSVEDVVGMSDAELALVEARNARATLAAGVTGIRAMGARDVDVHVRDRIAAGDLPGPRTVANCRSITATGGHGHHLGREITGVDDARKAVREQAKRGAEFIKFMVTGGVTTPGTDPDAVALTDAEVDALVEEAHRHGMHAATHAHGAAGVKAAVDAGVDTVEHGTFLDDDAVDALVREDVTLVPTLSAPYRIVRNVEAATADVRHKTERVYERHIESFRRAVEAGVRVAGGTDAGTPFNTHGANASEVGFMADYAMDPLDALTAMTKASADAVGLDGQGTLEPGTHADLLVCGADPTGDLTTLNDPLVVIKGGEVVAGADRGLRRAVADAAATDRPAGGVGLTAE